VPFAGRIKDGQYVFCNTKYNLFVNYPEEGMHVMVLFTIKSLRLPEKLLMRQMPFVNSDINMKEIMKDTRSSILSN
jgi:hypothetical protein